MEAAVAAADHMIRHTVDVAVLHSPAGGPWGMHRELLSGSLQAAVSRRLAAGNPVADSHRTLPLASL